MTVIGAVFIVLYIACLAFRRSWFPYVLGVAACVPDAAALVVGQNAVPPFYVGVLLAVPLIVFGTRNGSAESARTLRSEEHQLMWFIALGVVITLVAPVLFPGTRVMPPRTTIDVDYTVPLRFSASSLAQIVYVAGAGCAVVYFAMQSGSPRRIFEFVCWFAVLSALAIALLGRLGFAFPYSLIDNAPNRVYAIYDTRARGTFGEPSNLGAVASFALGFFWVRMNSTVAWTRMRSGCGVVAAAATVAISASGTAVVTVVLWAVIGVVLSVWALARSPQAHVRLGTIAAALAVLVPLVIIVPLAIHGISSEIVTKLGSKSYSDRSHSNDVALQALASTRGLGTGLGGDQASSLATYVLANVGIVGALLFLSVVWVPMSAAWKYGERALAAAVAVGVTAEFVALGQLSFPFLWLALGTCLASVGSKRLRRNQSKDVPSLDDVRPIDVRGGEAS